MFSIMIKKMEDEYKKIDVKTYNISFLNILKPTSRTTGYNSKIVYNNKDFKIQTPLCTIIDIDTKSEKPSILVKFNLSKNFSYFQFFSNIHEIAIEHLLRMCKMEICLF